MALTRSAEAAANTLQWFSAGLSATSVHGVGGPKILTTRALSSSTYSRGLCLSVRIISIPIVWLVMCVQYVIVVATALE
jgi:hypothetical protein